MSYSYTALLALLVHCIVNSSALRNRHFSNTTPAGKSYRRLMLCVGAFYLFDALWGVLYEAGLIAAVFADTTLYFVAMSATVYLWTRYVIDYLPGQTRFIAAFRYIGLLFLIFTGVILVFNFFLPVMFWFDEEGVYHAGSLRYALLAMQVLLFLLSAVHMLTRAGAQDKSGRLHHLAIGAFGITMTVMVVLQVFYPLLPLYAAGCLLGTSILHTFVLEDLREERRLELEEMLRKDREHQQELGSARLLAFTDALTGVKSSHAYIRAEQQVDERIANGTLKEFGVIVFDVNGLKQMNDSQGHEAGDQLIRDACRLICVQFKHSPVYRIGGDEFVAMLEGEDYRNRKALLEEFEQRVEENRRRGAVVVASGLAVFRPGQDNSYRRVFERADVRMYDRKGILKAM